jgi:hypothetical protein
VSIKDFLIIGSLYHIQDNSSAFASNLEAESHFHCFCNFSISSYISLIFLSPANSQYHLAISLSSVKNIAFFALSAFVDNQDFHISNVSNSTSVQWYVIFHCFSNHLIISSALLYFLASLTKS